MTNEVENAMNAIIDFSVKSNCWNLYDSYGEICVGCGCCSKDPLKRAKARYEVAQREIERLESFDKWGQNPKIRELQKKNIKTNLKTFRRMIRYYKKRIEELKNENNS